MRDFFGLNGAIFSFLATKKRRSPSELIRPGRGGIESFEGVNPFAQS
jgi:hypothetical protein